MRQGMCSCAGVREHCAAAQVLYPEFQEVGEGGWRNRARAPPGRQDAGVLVHPRALGQPPRHVDGPHARLPSVGQLACQRTAPL